MSTSAVATLTVMMEHLVEYQARVMAIAGDLAGGRHEDAVAVLHEADRNLRLAARTLRRAAQLIG